MATPLNLDGVELLETVERARRDVFFQVREGAERNELAVRPLDVVFCNCPALSRSLRLICGMTL